MDSTESPGNSASPERWARWDWAAALFLFLGTAAVVVWQNSRLAVLWDLSYVLENSYRISFGDFPYRDFPFPYAPVTFLIQSLLIKLTGRVFFHHVLYCAIVGGLGNSSRVADSGPYFARRYANVSSGGVPPGRAAHGARDLLRLSASFLRS